MRRSVQVILCLAVSAAAASARGSQVGSFVDFAQDEHRQVTPDGVFHASEFSFTPTVTMSAAGGGGGALQAPGALYMNAQGFGPEALSIGFQPGGSLDHTVIMLLNYRTGGRTRGSGGGVTAFNDTTDAARSALSSLQGTLLGSSPAFGAGVDAAITINAAGFGFFLMPDDAHSTFTQVGSYTGAAGATGYREAQFPGSNFGPSGISGFNFALVYADAGFLYNEAVPSQPYSSGLNPGQQIGSASPAGVSDFYDWGIWIPAPTTGLMMAFAGLTGLRRTRRR